MKLRNYSCRTRLQILQVLLLVSLLAIGSIRCEQTVFVLETSDSESTGSNSESSAIKSPQDEHGNTEIITDDTSATNSKRLTSDETTSRPRSIQTQAKTQSGYNTTATGANEQSHHTTPHEHREHPTVNHERNPDDEANASQHRNNSASRRSLENESELREGPHHHPGGAQHRDHPPPPHHHDHNHPPPPPPHHHKPNHPPHHPPNHNDQQDRNQQSRPKSGPSESSGVPKTEERLLISITSDDDDGYQARPPKVQNGGYEEVSSGNTHKRKPGFTIAIENPGGINKQIGSSGQAVILRPTEEGLVIVPFSNSGNNKQKPGGGAGGLLGGLVGALSESINQHQNVGNNNNNNNNNNNEPYREPVNTHNRPTSTTRPPPVNEPYGSGGNGNSNNNQPLVNTLLGGQRPQQPWTDERPQKPTYDGSNNSEPTRRPTSPPPFQETSSSNLQQGDYESNNNNNNNNNNHNNNEPEQQLGPKYPLNERNCGIMHETRIVGGEEAEPDDFMWMAAIIKSKPRDGEPRPFCGGSLITRRHILTAAHCLEGLAPRDVLVRLGGYDFEDTASSSSSDFAIDQFRVPAQYSKKTHVADIAIMRLKTPLSSSDNYKTVCMPQPRRSYVGALGTVTGYGSQSQTFRRAAPKLRQVTVPIWENRKCSVVYKKNLTESFLCAGYEEGGKDACQGDSGGPLMTEGPEQKMMIVGVVSHGIGCGAPGYPGVYTRTSTFTEWIEKNTKE